MDKTRRTVLIGCREIRSLMHASINDVNGYLFKQSFSSVLRERGTASE